MAEQDVFTLPEGRLINNSLFVKDAYNEQSKPSYKIEVAIPVDDPALVDLENRLLDAADDKWGKGAGDDENLVIPLLDGDNQAKKREQKEKEGGAYKGMTVIRANTIYNAQGEEGPGGIQVFDEDAERVEAARQGEIYNGCYGIAAVTIGYYQTSGGDNGLKFYLTAFQKTRDGEKLSTGGDKSGLFKPVGKAGGGERTRRRRPRD